MVEIELNQFLPHFFIINFEKSSKTSQKQQKPSKTGLNHPVEINIYITAPNIVRERQISKLTKLCLFPISVLIYEL